MMGIIGGNSNDPLELFDVEVVVFVLITISI